MLGVRNFDAKTLQLGFTQHSCFRQPIVRVREGVVSLIGPMGARTTIYIGQNASSLRCARINANNAN